MTAHCAMKCALATRGAQAFSPDRRAIKLRAQASEIERKLIPSIGAVRGLGKRRLINVKSVGSGLRKNVSMRISHSQDGANRAISIHTRIIGHNEPELAAGHVVAGQTLDDILGADTQSANRGLTLIV